MPIVHCDTCGNPIKKPPSLIKPHNFCNDACYRMWRRTLIGPQSPTWKGGSTPLLCPQCGQRFVVPRSQRNRRKYCSKECMLKAAELRTLAVCKNCGKEFKSYTKTRLFCSRTCYDTYRVPKSPRICQNCGGIIRHNTKSVFCSPQCRSEHRKKARKPMSEETKAKISASNTGKPGLCGPDNPMYRNGLNIEIKHTCSACRQSFIGVAKLQFCSVKCARSALPKKLKSFYQSAKGYKLRRRMSTTMTGKDNPNWRIGMGIEPYTVGFTPFLKEQVRKRDGYKCCLCGQSDNRALSVHHIDGSKGNHDMSNLISLCQACHIRVHQQHIDTSPLLLPTA